MFCLAQTVHPDGRGVGASYPIADRVELLSKSSHLI